MRARTIWAAAAVFLAAGALAVVLMRDEPAPQGPAAAPAADAAADRVVAPDGRDAGDCSARPCASLTYADSVAQPGDVVEIRAGRYAEQELAADHGGRAAEPVVFRAAPGARVRIRYVTVLGGGVELRGVTTNGWTVAPGAHDVTFRRVAARGPIFITSAHRVRVLGGSVGPGDSKDSQIKAADTEGAPVPTDILIDGVAFHDWTREEDPGAHVECLQVGGVRRLVVRDSSFRNCATHGVFVRSWGGTAVVEGVRFENNTFGATAEGFYALRVSGMDGMRYRGIEVHRNRSAQSLLVDEDAARDVSFVGNVAPRLPHTCFGDQDFRENVWDGARCGATDRDAPAGAA